MITVTALNIYPVKGLRGIALNSAEVLATGLRFDRQWVVVDAYNRFMTQREHAIMALIDVQVSGGGLTLNCDGHDAIVVPTINGSRHLVTIWKDQVDGIDQGNDVARWLQQVLGVDGVRLMHFAADARRPVKPDHINGAKADVGFADGYPFLIANEQTLTSLNIQLEQPVPMNRFRPNITLSGLMALEEHAIATLRGDSGLVFALAEACQRCKVPTINQDTAEVAEDREPLRTLLRLNPFSDKRGGYFGENAILLSGEGATLNVGDALSVQS